MAEESKDNSAQKIETEELAEFLDTQFTISIEFGRTKMSLKNILDLSIGSVVPIPKSAGDNVDLYLNNKLIGYGEIITVEETVGVGITEIFSA